MVDHAETWDAIPDWTTARLSGKDVAVRSIELPDQALVSGDLAAFARIAGMDAQGAGALGRVEGNAYTIRLARDRLLVVGSPPETIVDGWNEAGFAVTPMGGAYHVFALSGEGCSMLLSQATTLNPDDPGPSATVGFGGIPAMLYRHGPSAEFRLHVERGLAVYLWRWLQTALAT